MNKYDLEVGGGQCEGDICICYRDSFSKLFYINNSDQTKEVMTSKYSEDCKFTAFHLELKWTMENYPRKGKKD